MLGIATLNPTYPSRMIPPTHPLCAASISRKQGGGLGEHCSSPAVGRGVCAPPSRVAQPRLLAADRGNPTGAANRGRLFFSYFILAKQKKVTSRRATPGKATPSDDAAHAVP